MASEDDIRAALERGGVSWEAVPSVGDRWRCGEHAMLVLPGESHDLAPLIAQAIQNVERLLAAELERERRAHEGTLMEHGALCVELARVKMDRDAEAAQNRNFVTLMAELERVRGELVRIEVAASVALEAQGETAPGFRTGRLYEIRTIARRALSGDPGAGGGMHPPEGEVSHVTGCDCIECAPAPSGEAPVARVPCSHCNGTGWYDPYCHETGPCPFCHDGTMEYPSGEAGRAT